MPGALAGEFYGAAAGKTIGPLVPQGTIFEDLASRSIQENAAAAIHQFARGTDPR